MTEKQFVSALKELGIEITDLQLNQLQTYYELLVEWNKAINLTAITEKESVYLKHFYDSLTLVKIVDLKNIDSLCDVGSGAGFPGLVIKILFPKIKITLVDALNKRVKFLTYVAEQLDLLDIEILHDRAENFALKQREKFSLVTARAVAPLNILSEICLPLVKPDGYFIPLKGNISREIMGLDGTLKKLGARKKDQLEFVLPIENSQRTLLKIQKITKTDKRYPRRYAEIKKKPL